jgi:hypothetical protein
MTTPERCAQCKAERGVPRARAKDCYMLHDGQVFSLADGTPMGLARGSEFPDECLEEVSLTRAAPHLCQACRPKIKPARRGRRRRAKLTHQLNLFEART